MDFKGYMCFIEIVGVVFGIDIDGVVGGEECGIVFVYVLCVFIGVKDGCKIKVNLLVINIYFIIFF